jgi:hypothetical protein
MGDQIDYNTEYAEYRRCRTCNRKTNGIEEYINLRTKKPTKTCTKCRERIRRSLRKKAALSKPLTNRVIIEAFKSFLNQTDTEAYDKILNDPANQDLKILKKYRVVEKENDVDKDVDKKKEKEKEKEKA